MTARTQEQPVVHLQRTISAPPNRVYRAWLEPDTLRRWLAPGGLEVSRAEVDERAGGRYRIWQADAGREVGGFEWRAHRARAGARPARVGAGPAASRHEILAAMSDREAEMIARLRRAYELFSQGDFDGVVELGVHPDIEYLPIAGLPPVRGLGAFRAWMEPDAFESQIIDPLEIRVAGNKVLVWHRVRSRGAGSGIEMELDSWAVWTVDGAGLVIRVEAFRAEEDAEARRAAGLEE